MPSIAEKLRETKTGQLYSRPLIGHLKSNYRLGRNFYKGVFGDAINVMPATIAYNFKRVMRVLFALFVSLQKVRSVFRNLKQNLFARRSAYAMNFES